MTWTKHGHHIPTSPPTVSRPNYIESCGGTEKCGDCIQDMLEYELGRFKSNRDYALTLHVRRELERRREDKDIIDGYVDVITSLLQVGHSSDMPPLTVEELSDLVAFKNISPLSDSPHEWYRLKETYQDLNMWQNVRNSDAFSFDGGKTYYLKSDNDPEKFYTSEESIDAPWTEPEYFVIPEDEKISHYGNKFIIMRALEARTPVEGLCGMTWWPTKESIEYRVCPDCKTALGEE